VPATGRRFAGRGAAPIQPAGEKPSEGQSPAPSRLITLLISDEIVRESEMMSLANSIRCRSAFRDDFARRSG
jgi:hypothetical protein